MRASNLIRSSIACCFLPVFFNLAGFAQEVGSSTEADTIIELSPFEVTATKDVGYRAGATLAGTRTNEELINVPASITVLTEEFLSDIGATDLSEALQYSVGGQIVPIADESFGSAYFRGFYVPYNRQNFFIWTARTDSYNTERIDLARGPNGILFGDADPGGLANVNTKRAKFKNHFILSQRIGSNNHFRSTADANMALTKNWAARLNLLYQDSESWINWVYDKRKGVHGTTTYLIGRRTSIRVEGEYGKFERNFATALPRDRFSSWDGVTPYTTYASRPAGTGRISTADYFVYYPDQGAFLNLKNKGLTSGPTGNDSLPVTDESVLPRDFHFKGADQSQITEFYTYSIFLEHRVARNLAFEAAYNGFISTDTRLTPTGSINILQDPNATLPDGNENPYFGYHYYDQSWVKRRIHDYIQEARLSAVYDWRPAKWMSQRIFASINWRNTKKTDRSSREIWVNNPNNANMTATANNIRRRVYLELGDGYENTAFKGLINDPVTGIQSAWVANGNLDNGEDNLYSAQLSMSGVYWNGMLRTLIGVRRDYARNFLDEGPRDSVSGLRSPGPMIMQADTYKTSPNFGLVFRPWKPLTLFYNYSETFRPLNTGYKTFYGKPMEPRESTGHEGGVRLEFFGGKAYITASIYDNDLRNVQQSVETAVSAINDIWLNPQANIVDPTYSSNELYDDVYDVRRQRAKGTEIELWLNITKNWTLQAGYGYSRNKDDETSEDARNYINQYLPQWKAMAAENPAVGTAINAYIATIEDFMLTRVPGSYQTRANKWTANFFTRYKFSSGPLKGFFIGGGMNSTSGRVLYNVNNNGVISPVWGEGFTIFNGVAGYTRRLKSNVTWKIALNVNNLTDRDYLNQSGYDQTRWGAPRTFLLTNTFTF